MKLTPEQIEILNKNMILKETEKALYLRVILINNYTGAEKEIAFWVPKSCTEFSGAGILKIKD